MYSSHMSEFHRFDDERRSLSYLFNINFVEVVLSCQVKSSVGGTVEVSTPDDMILADLSAPDRLVLENRYIFF